MSRDDFNRGDFTFGGDEFGEEEPFADFDMGEESDVPEFGDQEVAAERSETIFGLRRPFFFLLLGAGALFCVVLLIVVAIILANQGPSDIDLTVTSVLATNTYVAAALNMTETRNAITNTPTPTFTPTATFTATPTETPTATPETPTPAVLLMTPTPQVLDTSAINQTATAIAAILLGGTPTPEEGVPLGEVVTATPTLSGLPQTGLFDDFGGGGGITGLATAGLAALGLAAVIFVARRLRTQ